MKTPIAYKPQAGFTLYELLITTVIVGTVMAFGMANLVDFTRNSRMTAAANDLHASFFLARSEAARARTNVSICSSTNPMAADPDCGGTFEDGWIVFLDPNGDVIHDAGEPILRAHDALDDVVNISTPGMDDYFSFSPSGLGRGAVAASGNPPVTTAVICDDRGNIVASGGRSAARVLIITPLGRATVLHSVAQVQTSIDNSGAACP
ncbi:MAG: GspH/FimT family pseudopilin [Woeseiaceae bacterium]|nr:GspH/FimT family pseudopilin [Woeseiaceae bacterium]